MRELGGREPDGVRMSKGGEGVDMLHVLETFSYCPSTHTHTHTHKHTHTYTHVHTHTHTYTHTHTHTHTYDNCRR